MHRLMIAALLPLAACSGTAGASGSPGTGSGNERTWAIDGFTAVELAGSDDVDVRVGPAFSIRATGNSATLDKLRLERRGDTLKIGRERGVSWGKDKAKVFVTLPQITGASLAGSGDMRVDRAAGDAFSGSIAGSGDLSVAGMQVSNAKLSIAGSGDLTAAGSATALKVSIAGSGNLIGSQLTARQADISVAGSGNVSARVDGAAKVSVMGSGDIDISGAANCTVRKMGSGTVRCGG